MDVLQDVNADVRQHDPVRLTRRPSCVVYDVAEDNPILRRRHLGDRKPFLEIVRRCVDTCYPVDVLSEREHTKRPEPPFNWMTKLFVAGTHLDLGTDVGEILRGEGNGAGLLEELVVAESGELESEVLQGVVGLVHQQHVQRDVELVHTHEGLCVHRIRETCQLVYLSRM